MSTARPPGPAGLIPGSSGRPGNDPIFSLNAEAQKRAAAGEKVINASIGALMEDDGKLAVMPAVFEAYAKVDPVRAAAYAPIAGDAPFRQAIIDDVLGGSPLADQAVAVATAGGTGAIHHAIVNFLDIDQSLFTSSYFWGPYGVIATHTRRGVDTFPMFDANGRFDLDSFQSGLRDCIARQGRALVVLNFPCHNPTGYSLDADEWTRVAEILLEEGRRAPVNFLLDLAYARYKSSSQVWVKCLEPIVEVCTLMVAWSASKSFAQYGSRIGGLIAVQSDAAQRDEIFNALSYSCRGTWSNCNHLGILAITELLSDPDLKARADEERVHLKGLLDERVAVFNREANAAGLSFPRYEGGFFVAVFTPDAQGTAAAAKEEGVFVVPMDGAVRVALCSTPSTDVPTLVDVLARAVEASRPG